MLPHSFVCTLFFISQGSWVHWIFWARQSLLITLGKVHPWIKSKCPLFLFRKGQLRWVPYSSPCSLCVQFYILFLFLYFVCLPYHVSLLSSWLFFIAGPVWTWSYTRWTIASHFCYAPGANASARWGFGWLDKCLCHSPEPVRKYTRIWSLLYNSLPKGYLSYW